MPNSLASKSEIGKKSCCCFLYMPCLNRWLTQIHTGPSHRGGSQWLKVTKRFRKLAFWSLSWWVQLYFCILGPISLWPSLIQRGRGDVGQAQEPPWLEKFFERPIVSGDEWLQSLGSQNWNAAYEVEHYYSPTHILQRKWNFSSWLVSFSAVHLWASFPRGAYFLHLTSHRERNQRSNS